MPDLPAILRPGQPENSERTKALGIILTDTVEALNKATLGDAPGLENPGDAYDLIGALHTAARNHRQLLEQLAAWWQNQSAAGKLAVTEGSTIEAVVDECRWLLEAGYAMNAVVYRLGEAHKIAGRIGGTEGEGDNG